MKHRLIVLTTTLLLMVVTGIPCAQSASKLPVVRIGIVRDGPVATRLGETVKLFQDEILKLAAGEFDIRFPQDKNIHGNWNADEIERAIDRLLADPEVDLIITLGFLASHDVCQRKKLSKPVVAPAIVDAQLQNLPRKNGASGVKNLSYVDPFTSFERDVNVFREIVPFKHLTVLFGQMALEGIPWLRQKMRGISFEFTIEVDVVGVGVSVEEALANLPPGTDALYVAPLPHLSPGKFRQLVSGLILQKLPSFSMIGRGDVEAGILASIAPKTDFQRLARRVALNVQRILLGEEAGSLGVSFPIGEELTINMATARAIGVYPTWSILTEAELLNEQEEGISRRLTLESAVQEAIAANLDLAVADRGVAAGEQAVREARAPLLPQVGLEAAGVAIDDDRAAARFGQQPERTLSGTASASQLLYSDDAWANFQVEGHLQTSREEQRETVRLDIALDAAVAYLNLLRAKTNERVQRENLRLTRANLERARVRVFIGIASRAEEFRWESEIATARQDVLRAQARVKQAEVNLNRLLHRPQGEQFLTEETDLSDPLLLLSDKRFFYYVDNPRNFRLFKDFLVDEGLALAPELLRIDADISAQKRIISNAKRAFWLPSFSVEGEATHLFEEGGEGQRSTSPTGLDDTDWSVGVFARFPFIEGGGKFATIKRASEELSGLRLDRQSTAEKIEQRIRLNLDQTGFSYPSIRLSRQGADASAKNLELVTDQYVRGVVSIIDLLDAQRNALVSAETADNAVYTFLIDLMRVQRATGRFDFFLSEKERGAWFMRLEEFFEKAGVSPWRR